MKRLFILMLVAVCLISACRTTNVLNVMELHKYDYYNEQSMVSIDSTKNYVAFTQDVNYNHPNWMDEEYANLLHFSIDTAALKIHKIFNLSIDTASIKASYSVFSIWNWSDENNTLSGTVEVLQLKNNRVKLKLDVLVNDIRREEKVAFEGVRWFTTTRKKNRITGPVWAGY